MLLMAQLRVWAPTLVSVSAVSTVFTVVRTRCITGGGLGAGEVYGMLFSCDVVA